MIIWEDWPIHFICDDDWRLSVRRITLVSSIFLIVGTGIERYLAVCRPHHYHRVGGTTCLPCLPVTSLSQVQDRPHRALAYIMPSIGAAVLLNIPRWAAQQLTNQIIRFISPSIGDKLYLMFNNFQTSIMFDNRSENIENIKFEEFKGLIYFHDGMSLTKN